MTDGRAIVAVTCRAPSDPGGKSRLLGGLDDEHGCDLRRALLADTLDAVVGCSGADPALLYTPADAAPELRALAPFVQVLFPQRGGDLGSRMHWGFVDLFARGAAGVILVGSDLPALPPASVQRAIDRLAAADGPALVIGPAADGGYYLIGLRRPNHGVLDGVSWGGPDVYRQTLARAASLGLTVEALAEERDVDVLADLIWIAHHAPPDRCRRTRAWLAAHLPAREEPAVRG